MTGTATRRLRPCLVHCEGCKEERRECMRFMMAKLFGGWVCDNTVEMVFTLNLHPDIYLRRALQVCIYVNMQSKKSKQNSHN